MKHLVSYVHKKAAFLLTLLFLVFICSVTYAQQQEYSSPKLKPVVEIEGLDIIGQPQHDRMFELEVRYKAYIAKTATISLHVTSQNGMLGMVQAPEGESILERSIMLEQNQTQTQVFTLLMNRKGSSMIEVIISVPEAPNGYSRTAYRYAKIKSTATSFELFDPRQVGDAEPQVLDQEVQRHQGTQPLKRQGQQHFLQPYTVSITGKIKTWQPEEFRYAGLYGNGVSLWFRNSNNPSMWYHPLPGNIKGTHYDILNEKGRFTFNFSFTGDLSAYDEAIILVNTANKATVMPPPQDGYIVWSGNGYTAYFNEETEGVVLPINGSTGTISTSGDGLVNSESGRILRYMMLSREFIEQRYGGSLPFNLPVIQTIKEELSGKCGVFSVNFSDPINGFYENIKIDPACSESSTTAHEYGHWINYKLWEGKVIEWGLAENTVQEGWAIFYSFAVRNYANKAYDDALRPWDDNPEEDAFVSSPFRYSGMRYAGGGHPEYAAAGCYFWNLYDNYGGNRFEESTYAAGDNDDLNGYGLRVFQKMDEVDGSIINRQDMGDYHRTFKSGLSSEIKTSVNKVYTFMFSNLVNVPSIPMLPPQVTAARAQLSGSGVILSWADQSYPGNVFFKNAPNGYKIYKKNGSNWYLLASLSYGTNSYTDMNGSISDTSA